MACWQFREDVLSLTQQTLGFHRQQGSDRPRSHSDRRLSLESPAPIGLRFHPPSVTSTKAAMPLIQGNWCVDADFGWAVVRGDGVGVAFSAEPEPVLGDAGGSDRFHEPVAFQLAEDVLDRLGRIYPGVRDLPDRRRYRADISGSYPHTRQSATALFSTRSPSSFSAGMSGLFRPGAVVISSGSVLVYLACAVPDF
jgi:hypothetical protein